MDKTRARRGWPRFVTRWLMFLLLLGVVGGISAYFLTRPNSVVNSEVRQTRYFNSPDSYKWPTDEVLNDTSEFKAWQCPCRNSAVPFNDFVELSLDASSADIANRSSAGGESSPFALCTNFGEGNWEPYNFCQAVMGTVNAALGNNITSAFPSPNLLSPEQLQNSVQRRVAEITFTTYFIMINTYAAVEEDVSDLMSQMIGNPNSLFASSSDNAIVEQRTIWRSKRDNGTSNASAFFVDLYNNFIFPMSAPGNDFVNLNYTAYRASCEPTYCDRTSVYQDWQKAYAVIALIGGFWTSIAGLWKIVYAMVKPAP